MARWLELLGEFDRRLGWSDWGSCAHWLAWRCGLDGRTAREHVRVARALNGLPLVRASFERGELSYAKVRALTRVSAPAKEDELLELAGELTASQLERALAAGCRVDPDAACAVQEAERLSWGWADDGSLVFSGRLAPEDGALFAKALEAARERLWAAGRDRAGGSAEPPVAPTRVEALVAVADASLSGTRERSGGDRYQVVVHVDAAALGADAGGSSVLEDGPPLAVETVRRLACDASLVTLVERAGKPLGVGRKTRSIPPMLGRALRARDGCCRFPGCPNTRFLHAHHVRHWSNGGPTDLENLMLLCRRHHRLVHEGGWTIDADGCFRDPFGRRLASVPERVDGDVEELLVSNERLQLGPRTLRGGRGERIDLSAVADSLFRIVTRRRGFPRPRLIWTEAVCDPQGERYGPVRIDTLDEHGLVLTTEALIDHVTPCHAVRLALSRGLDSDIGGRLHLAA
jgi:hypothetical protein